MTLYGYCRVSSDKQDNSLSAQQARLEEFAKQAGLELFHPLFVDEDVSGSLPLKRRAAGHRLWDMVQPGDTIAFTKLDRGFRNMVDAATTLQVLSQVGVQMRILDLPMDLATPEGRLIFHQFAAFSQFERERIGTRIREAMMHLKKAGKAYASARPYGWVRKGRDWVPCEQERKWGARALALRSKGASQEAIALDLLHAGALKPTRRRGSRGYYHLKDIAFLLRAATAGYPKLPRAWWQAPGYEQRLAAVTSGAPRQSSEGSAHVGTDPRPAPALPRADRPTPSADSQGDRRPATDRSLLAD
jgi:DNA invertase Pin-like site-specific DNA recombinase